MKKLFKLFTNKIIITIFFFLLQIAIIAGTVLALGSASIWVYLFFVVLSLFVCLFILGKDANPGYKLAWVVPILIFPLFGGLMFLSLGRQSKLKRKDRQKLQEVTEYTEELFSLTSKAVGDSYKNLSEADQRLYRYIRENTGYTLYNNTKTTYYNLGEKAMAALLEELKKAEKFIFIEFFIIAPGKFWNAVLDVLQQKVAEGVEVRLIYDDMGCLFTLPASYHKKLNKMGIKTRIFNRIKPTFDIRMNNRTHRKIVIIYSKVAFTGGFNLADEYINEFDKFGHWKDTGMKFEGYAAWSFTIMFLRFWMLLEKEDGDYMKYLPYIPPSETAGYVQPLVGGPGQNQQVIENTFMQMINNATEYVYINTPYLILDNEFVTCLTIAAKSGVDVRITMPHIPDKKMVFLMSRSFYPVLLKAGVKIYEYLPGFMHAKSLVCDDKTAFIGTCNLDYRSFYLHYECGAVLYGTESIETMKQDYLTTLDKCKQISFEEANDVTILTKMARSVLRLIAPLL